MKAYFKIFLITSAISLPMVALAQKPDFSVAPFSSGSLLKAKSFKLSPSTLSAPGPSSPFMAQLPILKMRESRVSSPDTVFQYNMPIVKPAITSKILIADPDNNNQYIYRMPVKKNETVED